MDYIVTVTEVFKQINVESGTKNSMGYRLYESNQVSHCFKL
jgi:hypothetical protein